MMREISSRAQRGAVTIFVAMIMLLMITVLVLAAYTLSTMNLQAAGNAQVRQEAIAAANQVIERVIDSSFTNNPAAAANAPYGVDFDGDTLDDYTVTLQVPDCVRATELAIPLGYSVTLGGLTVGSAWLTIWELDARATEATTGASVRVLHGVRVLLSDAEKTAVCPG